MTFLWFFWVQQKTAKITCFFGDYYYKIAKNRPISMKLTVPNRQGFAIFKTSQFFYFGQILICEGSDLQIFGRLKVNVRFLKKMDFTKYKYYAIGEI